MIVDTTLVPKLTSICKTGHRGFVLKQFSKKKKIHGDALQREKSAKTKQKNLVANL